MGKRKKRMTMKKYANKYATKRAALKSADHKVTSGVVIIDMTSSEEVQEDESVEVITNTPVKEKEKETTPSAEVEPALQIVQVEEPSPEEIPPPAPKAKRPPRRKKASSATKKPATTKTSSTRKRTVKKKLEE